MSDQQFVAAVSEPLDPALAPRGLPWRELLHASYGTAGIPCLDLWVQLQDGRPDWRYEVFEVDVATVAGQHAMDHLRKLGDGPVEAWADQLGAVLDGYFQSLEGGRADSIGSPGEVS